MNSNNFKLEFGSGAKVIVASSKLISCIFKDYKDVCTVPKEIKVSFGLTNKWTAAINIVNIYTDYFKDLSFCRMVCWIF